MPNGVSQYNYRPVTPDGEHRATLFSYGLFFVMCIVGIITGIHTHDGTISGFCCFGAIVSAWAFVREFKRKKLASNGTDSNSRSIP